MNIDIKKNNFNALLELIKTFPEVGKIKIGSSNDGTNPPIVTENEWPSGLNEAVKKRFPEWVVYRSGDPVIHENTGQTVIPLERQY